MPVRRLLLTMLVMVGLGCLAPPVSAEPAASPTAFVSTLVAQGVQLLKNKQLTEQQRAQQFATLLRNGFDEPRIARFVLGRYWLTASAKDRADFIKYFEEWIVRTYASRFREYSGETVKVIGSRPVSAETTIVLSQIQRPNGPPTKVSWRVRKDQNDYKIVDVEVEGVSMALTQRDEFASVIQQNGGSVAGLNRALEQKLASGQPGASTQSH